MKTVWIATSPKPRWSNSTYLLNVSRMFAKKDTVWIHFQGAKDHRRICEELKDADALVFGMALYVDGIPSHILGLLQEIEKFAKKEALSCKVYALCNCGFYEGEHCEGELAMLACWCRHCSLPFYGGVGIGAGEMIGVLRFSPFIGIFLMLVQFFISVGRSLYEGSFSAEALLGHVHPLSLVISVLMAVLFSFRPWLRAAQLGRSVSMKRRQEVRFTTVSCCPAFLFVCFGSIYWVLRAFLLHLVPVWRLFRKV